MSRTIRNFIPIENKTIVYAASAASANVQFVTNVSFDPVVLPDSIEIMNGLTVDVFVAWGTTNGVVATVAGSYHVGAGVDKIISIGSPNAWVAVIPASSATGNVYISRGIGS